MNTFCGDLPAQQIDLAVDLPRSLQTVSKTDPGGVIAFSVYPCAFGDGNVGIPFEDIISTLKTTPDGSPVEITVGVYPAACDLDRTAMPKKSSADTGTLI